MVSDCYFGSMESYLKDLFDSIDSLSETVSLLREYPNPNPSRDEILHELTDLSYKIDECARMRTQVYERVINNLSDEYEIS